ncbi:MAG: NADPH-dependent F420 reductase [Actinomycetota bacterium]|nr:NADPH-dependent F420 reductase [Actinomycetota bacterium]
MIGATGPAGRAVAVQFAALGEQVVVGSRSQERADEAVAELRERWPGRGLDLVAGLNAAACEADLVVLATPWEGVPATLAELAPALRGRLVVSMANAMTRWGRYAVPVVPPTGSVTAAVALALPESRVAGAFHNLPAGAWADLEHPLDADVLVVAERRADAREVVAIVDRLPGLRGVDAGNLANALAVEAITATLVGISQRYKGHAFVRIGGIERG